PSRPARRHARPPDDGARDARQARRGADRSAADLLRRAAFYIFRCMFFIFQSGCPMRKLFPLLALTLALGAFADDPAPDASALPTRGLRMKLVPPPAPKPLPGEGGEDPLAQITDHMTEVVGDLAALKTDVPVQDKQKQVV